MRRRGSALDGQLRHGHLERGGTAHCLAGGAQAGDGGALAAHAWLPGGVLAVADARGDVRTFDGDRPARSLRLQLPGAPRALLARGRGLLALFPGALAVCAPVTGCRARCLPRLLWLRLAVCKPVRRKEFSLCFPPGLTSAHVSALSLPACSAVHNAAHALKRLCCCRHIGAAARTSEHAVHGSRPATQRRAAARACRAAGAAAHGPAELALVRTLCPLAGAPLAHACLAPGGAALLVATAAGALLLVDLSADGLSPGTGTAVGTAATAATPGTALVGSASPAADGAPAQAGAQAAAMGAPAEAAAGPGGGADPGHGAPPGSPDRQECSPALPGDAGQGCDPARQGSLAASGLGEDGGAGDGAPSGAGAAGRGAGPGERAQGAAGE
jgi:hypothetical protein